MQKEQKGKGGMRFLIKKDARACICQKKAVPLHPQLN